MAVLRGDVTRELEAVALEADADLPTVEGIICTAVPFVAPLLRRLADLAADRAFWPVRFVVRNILHGLVDALEEWGESKCGAEPADVDFEPEV